MVRILVISILIIINYHVLNSQEIKKEKVYLLFEKNDTQRFKSLGYKFYNKKGINFNLNRNSFINSEKMNKDTLCLIHINDYKLAKESELKFLEKEWRKKNEKALKNKYILHKQIDRNGVFDINIIEIINKKQMIIYQVKFRNEGAVE